MDLSLFYERGSSPTAALSYAHHLTKRFSAFASIYAAVDGGKLIPGGMVGGRLRF